MTTRPMSAYRSGFQLNLGLMTVPVNLYSVIPSKKGNSTHTLCAEHKVRIKQVYQCPEGEELSPETVKAVEVTKGNYVVPEVQDIPEIPAEDGIQIVAVPTDMVDATTVPTNTLYYLEPHQTAHKAWEILYRLAKDRKRTLLGQTTLRANSRKIYRLTVFNEYLVMQALEFPEHIREAPERSAVTVEKALMDQAKAVLDAIEVPWDTVDTSDEALRRFQEIAQTGEKVTTATTTEPSGDPIDLMEALKQSVAATKTANKAG